MAYLRFAALSIAKAPGTWTVLRVAQRGFTAKTGENRHRGLFWVRAVGKNAGLPEKIRGKAAKNGDK